MLFWPYYRQVPSAAGTAPVLTSANYSRGDTLGGGQSIALTGTNLSGASVTIGGNVATVTANTSTSVTFTLPAHAAGAVTITVTTAGGTSNTLAFTYWTPAQITGIDCYLDARKGWSLVGGSLTWTDQSANALVFAQPTGINQPSKSVNAFGTGVAGILFVPETWVALGSARILNNGKSYFAVAKWTFVDSERRIISDDTGSYNSLGASTSGAIVWNTYNAAGTVAHATTRGSALNDGVPRLFGVTVDTSANEKLFSGATQQGATQANADGYSAVGYSCVGNAYGHGTGWSGTVGALVMTDGPLSSGDLAALHEWSRQSFGAAA